MCVVPRSRMMRGRHTSVGCWKRMTQSIGQNTTQCKQATVGKTLVIKFYTIQLDILDLKTLKQHLNWIPQPRKPLKCCIMYESSPLSFVPVIYIQLDGGHVGFCQDGCPIGLTWLQIIETTSGLASQTLNTPKLMYNSWFYPLVFKLQLTSQPVDGHFGFWQYGGTVRLQSCRPSKIQTVWHWGPFGQIWCFWRNLNQNIPYTPDYIEIGPCHQQCCYELKGGAKWQTLEMRTIGGFYREIICLVGFMKKQTSV